jgi:hypothetical protein
MLRISPVYYPLGGKGGCCEVLRHKEFRLEVWEFSKIHYRVVGELSVDYWPTTGRAWLVGSFDGAKPMTVAEVCGLAWGLKQDVDI